MTSEQPPEPVKVMIVDDHPVVREGLRMAILDAPGVMLAGEATNGAEAEDTALRVKPDVILMDINLPGRDGLDTMLALKEKLPGVKVLVLTVSDEQDVLFRAIRLGADGFMSKSVNVREVVDAIRRVATGEVILSPGMTAKLVEELKRKPQGNSLSPREAEILELLGEGLTTGEIARRLYLGEGTVSTYARRLIDKLHLKNRAEAIAYAARLKKKG